MAEAEAKTAAVRETFKPYKQLHMDYINAMFFGPFGSGKTVLAATAQTHPLTGNALYISAEGGHSSIRDFGINVDIVRINTFKQFNKVYEFCRNHAACRDKYIEAKTPEEKKLAEENLIKCHDWLVASVDPDLLMLTDANDKTKMYQSVIIDSLTEVHKYAMYYILGVDLNRTSLDIEPAIPQLQHWGKATEMIRMLVRAFRDLRMHSFFTALDNLEKDERDGSIMILPSLPGKLSKEVCGFLDIVGYLHVGADPNDKTKLMRSLQVQPSGKYNAKSRYMALGTFINDPSVGKMVEMIIQGKQA